MSGSVFPREATLAPQQADGLRAGALMAVVAHLGLLLALAFGVNWHASEPEGVTAELWAAVPQAAAPPAAEPPPQPMVKETPKPQPKVEPPPKPVQRDAEIAIEKEREKQKKEKERELQEQREKAQKDKAEKEKAEKDKAAQDKLAKAEADRRKKEEEGRLAKLREDNLRRLMGQVGGTGVPSSTGTAARSAGPSASYGGKVVAAIQPNILYTDEINAIPGNPRAEVEIRLAPDGQVLGRRIVQSSGIKAWDEAVLRAIDKTAALPRDTDGTVPPVMNIGFRPKDLPKGG